MDDKKKDTENENLTEKINVQEDDTEFQVSVTSGFGLHTHPWQLLFLLTLFAGFFGLIFMLIF